MKLFSLFRSAWPVFGQRLVMQDRRLIMPHLDGIPWAHLPLRSRIRVLWSLAVDCFPSLLVGQFVALILLGVILVVMVGLSLRLPSTLLAAVREITCAPDSALSLTLGHGVRRISVPLSYVTHVCMLVLFLNGSPVLSVLSGVLGVGALVGASFS